MSDDAWFDWAVELADHLGLSRGPVADPRDADAWPEDDLRAALGRRLRPPDDVGDELPLTCGWEWDSAASLGRERPAILRDANGRPCVAVRLEGADLCIDDADELRTSHAPVDVVWAVLMRDTAHPGPLLPVGAAAVLHVGNDVADPRRVAMAIAPPTVAEGELVRLGFPVLSLDAEAAVDAAQRILQAAAAASGYDPGDLWR